MENTAEWLDARVVDFKEDKKILGLAKKFASMFSSSIGELSKKYIESFIKVAIVDDDKAQWIFEETINILEKDYNMEFKDIKI